ncbi:hypothetical protein vseg_005929 [Gypsophila vaccaria]
MYYYHYHYHLKILVSVLFLCRAPRCFSVTDPGDAAVLREFANGIQNKKLLNWPDGGEGDSSDPCGDHWDYVYCDSQGRVTQIQAKNLGLIGTLPKDFNKLEKLENLGLQNNDLTGILPSFKGLSELKYIYLDYNNFSGIPPDFFDGLVSLLVVALDYNPYLNGSNGWGFPVGLQGSVQLANVTMVNCNLVGVLPDFLGGLSSLGVVKLSSNHFYGGIPRGWNGSNLEVLWLNGQSGSGGGGAGGGLSGPIDVVGTMVSLSSVWLHGNKFSGAIPADIGKLVGLKEFDVNSNQLVGLVPPSLGGMELESLDLSNNHFVGPVPEFKAKNVSYKPNDFCQSTPGVACAPQVMALLDFLGGLEFPLSLSNSWSTNDPCVGWLGVICDDDNHVGVINLPNRGLNGTLSPSIGKLGSLTRIILNDNNIIGQVPSNWTDLKSLTVLDLSNNNLSPPWPKFSHNVKFSSDSNTPRTIDPSPVPGSQSHASPPNDDKYLPTPGRKSSKLTKLVAIIAPVSVASLVLLIIPLYMCYCMKRKHVGQAPSSIVIHPRDLSDVDNSVKIVVANNTVSSSLGSGSASRSSTGQGESHFIEAGNLVISVQVLRNVTKNFAPENELGRGGFGIVYKGELEDGTKIAVKRMEAGVISCKASDEFGAEIAVLSKVRHRHLVSLLGYSTEANERILVYEYMPQGALSSHLFNWKTLNLEPLSWKRRLNIALDVARGMEYLHSLAHQSFIHRDLKSSNILLGDDFRAKISDFGLVKLAPDQGHQSVVTRLAGTFGYLAPEYAVTGKITTKVDVFSFGVVLMELITGLKALDERRPEYQQHLAAWFWRIKSDREKLLAAVDPALEVKGDTIDSIVTIAELAGHCTAREATQRPDMGHAVNVLAPLVEQWKPWDDDTEEYSGIDYSLPLTQMVKGWQESEDKDLSCVDLEDSKGSIPARPTGFADSFTSTDGR